MKFKNLIFLIIVLVFSGCSIADFNNTKNSQFNEHHFNEKREIGPSINSYFQKNISTYYREISNFSIECKSGDCPDESIKSFLSSKNCFFCANYSEVFDNEILIHISPTNNADMFPGCTKKDTFSFPGKLAIIKKDKNQIIAIGVGQGHQEKIGERCDANYSYSYKTYEKWIFSTDKLGNETQIEVVTSNNLDEISTNGLPNPNYANSEYSKDYVDIFCNSPLNFNVEPYYEVIEINGHKTKSDRVLSKKDYEIYNDDKSKTRLYFSSYYDADYLIKPYCRIYGAEVDKVYSNKTIMIKVRNSPSGKLDEKFYKN